VTELDALRDIDADIHAALEGSGLAGVGFYTAPEANFDVRVRLFLDRNVQVLGEFGQVLGHRDEMRLMLADVPEPKGEGRVLVEATPGSGVGETWQLVKKISDDGSLSRWSVRRV
jgi:hypothetical protein